MSEADTIGQGGELALFDRWVARIENALAYVSAVCIFGMMCYAVVQIVTRRFFDLPLWGWLGISTEVRELYTVFAWGYLDMVEQLMALFAFVAVAYCERLGGHVRMELIISRLKGRSYWFVEALGILVGLIFIAIMIPPSFEHFMRAYELGDSTIDSGIPTWPSKLTVPVSFSLLWLRMFVELVGYIRLVIWPEAQPVAVPQLRDIEEQAAEEIRDTFGDEVASDGGRG